MKLSDSSKWLKRLFAFGAVAPARVVERWVRVIKVGDELVDTESALTFSSVWRAVNLISASIAGLPWHVMEINNDRRRIAAAHPADWVLHRQANGEMSAVTWRETALRDALLWGNHYSEIQRDAAGRIIALWPLSPDRCCLQRDPDTGSLVLSVWSEQSQVILPYSNVFHLRGLGSGVLGYSVVGMASRTIGSGIAQDQFARSFIENGTHLGGVIQPQAGAKLSPEARKFLLDRFEQKHKGGDKAFRTEVLDDGLDYKPIGMPLVDAQFLESRKFSVTEIARWFGVPPHKLADLEKATFSNIEHQALEFVTDTLLPWMRRLECEADAKLIGRNQRSTLTTRLNANGLLRGDFKTRMEGYAVARQNGWMSANDIRRLEDMDIIAGGDEYLVQLNMAPADLLRERTQAEIDSKSAPADPPEGAANDTPPDSQAAPDAQALEDNIVRLIRNHYHG